MFRTPVSDVMLHLRRAGCAGSVIAHISGTDCPNAAIRVDPPARQRRRVDVVMTVRRLRRTVPAVEAGPGPDAVLLARIRAGDEVALGVLYDQHAGLVYGLARRVTRDDHLAQDITQDVFAYHWELPDRVDLTRGSLRSYLAVVAHRRAVDEVRRSIRRTRTETAGAPLDVHESPEVGVVDAAAGAWLSERIAAGLAQLPHEQRTAIRLAYYEGQTYVQVARTLGIPEGTAKSRLRLALARLRALLDDELRTAI
jgi:RNA polymerase sigma-70 factor (ECF subfamily)